MTLISQYKNQFVVNFEELNPLKYSVLQIFSDQMPDFTQQGYFYPYFPLETLNTGLYNISTCVNKTVLSRFY